MDFVTSRFRSWNRERLARRRARNEERHRQGRLPLAVMGIVKNEAWNIEEWLDHYCWQGADHVFLIDNGSTDDTAARIRPWIESGFVTVAAFPERHRQVQHYRKAFGRFGLYRRFEWLLVADADEFWFCKDGRSLPDALRDFGAYAVIYCNWTQFGSGGRRDHPASLRRELTLRDPHLAPHRDTKWIARTEVLRGRRSLQVHKVFGACSSRTLTANETFQVNHYRTQSLSFWQDVKMARGDVLDTTKEDWRDMAGFLAHDTSCTIVETLLADRVAAWEAETRPIPRRA
jgi:hypothetical protein